MKSHAGAAGLCGAVIVVLCAPARAVEPLPTTELAPGVFVYQAPVELLAPRNQGAIANVGFIVGAEAVAVVDTGNTREAGERLLAAVRARTALPVRYVINTHMHPDHALGDVAFKGTGAVFVAHAKFTRALTARAEAYLEGAKRALGDAYQGSIDDIVRPSIEVAPGEKQTLDLGDRRIELEAMKTAHTDNDLTVLDKTSGAWFLGDLLFVTHLPSIDGSLEGWVGVMNELRTRSVSFVVPGHGKAPSPWPGALAPQQRYFDRLRSDVEKLIDAGASLRQASEKAGLSERDAWALFDEFNARNAIEAYREQEWR